MKKRLAHGLKLMLVLSLVMSLLSACGAAPSVQDTYPLESVSGSGQSTSYVYRAANRTVPEVAQELSDQRKPDQISAESTERMFLVYSDQYYHLQQDPKKPEDTLVEVDSKEYVRQNYSSSFLQGYLTATLIGNLFDAFGGRGSGNYRGYAERDTYKPKAGSYRAPTSNDKKLAPPLTVERKGSITRRGSDKDTSVGSGGGLFDRKKEQSRGSIDRNKSSGGLGDLFDSPKKSYKKPKTRVGGGRIMRRR
ncbi:DUF4247 domain-containing protein [Paenibacillus barcinonensis]|uniref:DUF4247 domain-containing protein n=1 Tax=Paenibacillus barcinonensis TaxID=198119 RepID=A0A2V4V8U7_PAEBA|nr:DUF4247 domain-containing protein [Paenibacillus barcinonensis]PYE49195.1 uncharacterized protein DUF4247 [Paenibacillus barcinonensis]QKS55429.1 DUF4247 domain-containing protein [Paenibacillus barcinonensis]